MKVATALSDREGSMREKQTKKTTVKWGVVGGARERRGKREKQKLKVKKKRKERRRILALMVGMDIFPLPFLI